MDRSAQTGVPYRFAQSLSETLAVTLMRTTLISSADRCQRSATKPFERRVRVRRLVALSFHNDAKSAWPASLEDCQMSEINAVHAASRLRETVAVSAKTVYHATVSRNRARLETRFKIIRSTKTHVWLLVLTLGMLREGEANGR